MSPAARRRPSTVTTFALLPGAGSEASYYWRLVAQRLAAAGHEPLPVDLPLGDDDAGLDDYATTVVRAVGDRDDVVVVGQSMAGFCAPQAAVRTGARLLVLVCPMIPAPGETPGNWWTSAGQADVAEEPDEAMDIEEVFLHDVPDDVKADLLSRPAPRQADTPFADQWPLPAWPDVPTRVVAGRHDRLLPLDLIQRLARERVGVEADVVDSGHLPALSRPDDLARLLLSYV